MVLMTNKALQTWAWVLLYGGLLALVLGLFVPSAAAMLKAGLLLAGGVAAVTGACMIWWRSRRDD
jgi:hypothetical protein